MICGTKSRPLGGQSGPISGRFHIQLWPKRQSIATVSAATWPLFQLAAASVNSESHLHLIKLPSHLSVGNSYTGTIHSIYWYLLT